MALDLFEEIASAPPAGRDLFREPSAPVAQPGRDLFKEFGAQSPADRAWQQEPTAEELARASRPALMTTTRAGQPVLQPNTPEPLPEAPTAPWTGEGGVLESLPAQMVAGARGAGANLRRMWNEESVGQRRDVIEDPVSGETAGGAVTGRAAPGAVARQTRLLAQDRGALEQAERDATIARSDLQAVTPRDMSIPQQAVSSLAQSAPTTLAGIATGILTRNPALAMTIAGGGGAAIQAGSTYGEAREKGAPHRLAATAATIDGILEGVGETLALRTALRPGVPVMKQIIKTIAAESGQEAATQAAQDLNAFLTYDPNITLKEAWHNVKVAALAGGMGGAVYGGAGAAVNASRRRAVGPVGDDARRAPITGVDPADLDQATGNVNLAPSEAPLDASQSGGRDLLTEFGIASGPPDIGAGIAPAKLPDAGSISAAVNAGVDSGATTLTDSGRMLFGFTEAGAQKRAEFLAQRGRPSVVIPHPSAPGRFAVIDEAGHAQEQPLVAQEQAQASTPLPDMGNVATAQPALLTQAVGPVAAPEQAAPAVRTGAATEWVPFTAGSGTLGVPRAEMPQVKAEHRGALVNFLTARGITHQQESVPASSLKATQAEYSPAKVAQAKTFEGGDRSILISADNHIVDGHHQALAKLETGEPIQVTRLNAPIRDLLPLVAEFPSAEAAPRGTTSGRDLFIELGVEPVAGDAVAMLPGSNYAGFIDDGALASSGVPSRGEPIRREDVLARFLKALNVPIYEGRMQGGKRMGYYRPKLETVRIKRASDLETAAHELAHLIDDRVFNGFGAQPGVPKTRPWITGPKAKTFAAELRSVSYDATKVYEGYAEWVRLWMTQPVKAAAAAPEFAKWFETFIKQHAYGPAIHQAQQDMLAWFDQDALSRARSKIGETESINQHLDGFWDRFRQSTADDLHGVYRMERDLAGEITPRGAYETARLTRGAHAIMDGAIRYGHLVRNTDGSFGFKGKGLEQILKPVSNQIDDFLLYAVGRSARELKAQGREHLFAPAEIKAMVELETPEFRKAFAEYQAWNKGILDFAEAHGVINAHARSMWKRVEYLPFHRVDTGETQRNVGGAEGNWKGIQKLTGGTSNIRDVLGNIIGNASMLIDVSLKNDARASIARLAQTKQGGGRFMERIPAESRKVKIDKEQIRQKLLEAAGVSGRPNITQAGVAKTIDEILQGAPFLMDFLVTGQTPTGGNIMAVLKDGKPTYYEVIDPILYRAVSALNRPAQNTLLRWLSLPKRIGQASITLTPDFALANIARDTVMGAVMSRSGFLPVTDSIRGLTARLKGDPAYIEYIANGGGYASYFVDEGAFRTHLQHFYSQRGINPRTVIDGPQKLLYFMETLFDAFEVSTRLGEFKRLRAKGVHPRQAAYLGREISTDFGMRGDSRTLGFFYDTVMFLRPAVVSMDRLFRGVAHDPNRGAIAAKTAAIALVSAMLFLLNRDKDEYKDLEDFDRDSYWHFFIPKPGGGDLHFRYPKIWEVGAIATLAERTVERIIDGKPKEYAKDFGRVLKQAFNLNFMPQAIAPLYEQAVNEDSFTKRPIEPRGLEDLQPFLRAKPYTSETLRQLGMATKDLPESLQVNPVRAEALLTGYLNTWAMYGLMAADAALFTGKLPERRLDQYPVIRRFFRQEPPVHTKHEQVFYEMLDETRRLRATMRELDRRGEERDLGAEDEAGLSSTGQIDRVQREIAGIRRQADVVRRSDLSPAEKRRELDELTAGRNAIFKEAVQELGSDARRRESVPRDLLRELRP